MNLDFLQVTFLSVLQGATEFLPISSSGHLILPSLLFSWSDQGLAFDVAVHVGTLLAVLLYFRGEVQRLATAAVKSVVGGERSNDSRLAWMLIAATVPAGVAGLLFGDYVEQYGRSLPVIASTSIIFALLLLWSDNSGNKQLSISNISWKIALIIGFAQVLALIPGTSRSGITMTAALFCNMNRAAAARFSFLLSIPIIMAGGLLKGVELSQIGITASDWVLLLYAIAVSAGVAYLCIHYFLQLIEKLGFLPFVIYRVLLGIGLLVVAL